MSARSCPSLVNDLGRVLSMNWTQRLILVRTRMPGRRIGIGAVLGGMCVS